MPSFTIYANRDKRLACDMIAKAELGMRFTLADDKHSDAQRAKLNAMCGEIAAQATHAGLKLTKDDWRHMIAAMVFKLRIVPSIDGDGVVTLSPSTAQMTGAEMAAMIEGAYFTGAQFGVTFKDSPPEAVGDLTSPGGVARIERRNEG